MRRLLLIIAIVLLPILAMGQIRFQPSLSSVGDITLEDATAQSITVVMDGDTIKLNPYKQLYMLDIEVGNTRIFSVDSTGEVHADKIGLGIITNPSRYVDVRASGTSAYGWMETDGAGADAAWYAYNTSGGARASIRAWGSSCGGSFQGITFSDAAHFGVHGATKIFIGDAGTGGSSAMYFGVGSDRPLQFTSGATVFNVLDADTDFKVISDDSTNAFVVEGATGNVGIGTTAPDKAVEINSATGANLRLTYNDADGSATYYTDFATTSGGDLTVTASGGDVTLSSTNLDIVPSSSTANVLRTKSLQSTAPLGSELITNGTFDSDLTGWTISGTGSGWAQASGEASHNTGNTDSLYQAISVTNGTTYQISITITDRTAGSIAVSIGGVYIYNYGAVTTFTSSATRTLVASGTGSQDFIIAPTTNFDGDVDAVSVKAITGTAQPVFIALDDDAESAIEIRADGGLSNTMIGRDAGRSNTIGNYNTFLGRGAGYSNTTGYYNTFMGRHAGYSNTTGNHNTFLGRDAGRSNTTGYYNTFLGHEAGQSNTTGNYNTFLGINAGYSNTIGYYNTFLGINAGYSNTTGYYNTFLGRHAGSYLANGSSANDSTNSSVYVGYDTRASDNEATNENVFGYSAIGKGSNTVTLGNSNVTNWLPGTSNSVEIGSSTYILESAYLGTLTLGDDSDNVSGQINWTAKDGDAAIDSFGIADRRYFTGASGGYVFTDGIVDMPDVYAHDMNGETIRAMQINDSGELGYDSSSKKAKTNIQNIRKIEWFDALRPVTYNPKKNLSMFRYGLIAEEVAKVIPVGSPIVFPDEKGKPAGINYDELIPVLIHEVQSLKARVAELEAQIN